jgi:hypothetical protein
MRISWKCKNVWENKNQDEVNVHRKVGLIYPPHPSANQTWLARKSRKIAGIHERISVNGELSMFDIYHISQLKRVYHLQQVPLKAMRNKSPKQDVKTNPWAMRNGDGLLDESRKIGLTTVDVQEQGMGLGWDVTYLGKTCYFSSQDSTHHWVLLPRDGNHATSRVKRTLHLAVNRSV